MLENLVLWGPKTHALFDVWSIEHFWMGLNAAVLCRFAVKTPVRKCWPFCVTGLMTQVLLLSFIWEISEFYMEAGFAGHRIAYWFQGIEHPLNRLFTDQLMVILGVLTAQRFPHWGLAVFARIFSIGWLIIHIFIFNHSMVLQDML